MLRHLNGFTLLSSLALMAAIVVVVGCSSNAPLGPNVDNPGALDKVIPTLPTIAAEVVEAAKLIRLDRADSIAIVRGDATHEFIIPAGALSANTIIDVKSAKDIVKEKKSITFEFGPDGLVFNQATTLDIDISDLGTTARTANLYYFDPGVRDWVLQGLVLISDGHAKFSIYHFSKYAIN